MEITEFSLLTVKAESVYGTDPVPLTTANAIPTMGDTVTWEVSSTPVSRKGSGLSMLSLPSFITLPSVTLKFRYEVRGNRTNGSTADISAGAVAQAVEIDALLKAANLAATYTAETSAGTRNGFVIYKPTVFAGSVGPSITAYWYTAQKLHKLVGGKVNIERILFEAGKPTIIEFLVRGKYVAPADNTFPTSATFLATAPLIWDATNGAQYSVDVWANGVVNTMEFSLGNTIEQRTNSMATNNVEGFIITGTDPKGKMDPETTTEADNAFWANWRAGTVQTLFASVGTGAAQTGNKFSLQVNAQFVSVNYSTRGKVRVHDAQYQVVRSSLADTVGNQVLLQFS